MHKQAIVFSLVAALTAPVSASDGIEPLREALGSMPEVLLTNPDPIQIAFIDMEALRALEGDLAEPGALLRVSLAQTVPVLSVLMAGGVPTWDDKAGIPLDEISWFAGFGNPPNGVTYWGLPDSGTASNLLEALADRDFVAFDTGDTGGVLGNGEPARPDFERRDPHDPWRGSAGQASFVLGRDTTIMQAPHPQALAGLGADGSSVADNRVMETALHGLAEALGVEGSIVQAAVISPAFGMAAGDPAAILRPGLSIEEAREALEASIAAGEQGIPPYFGGILADTQTAEGAALTVALAYQDCAIAASAVATIEARWQDLLGEALPARISGTSVAAPNGMCAAVTIFAAPDRAVSGNPIASNVMRRFMQRDFTILQIGLPAG